MQFIDLKTQSKRIESALFARFQTVLDHGAFIMGPEIAELETQLSQFTGAKHAITLSSGTDALLIALMALGIQPGDEIITTPFSFFATAEVILLLGAKPVFVDIDPETYNIDPDLIDAAITQKTKAIIPVSLYGLCADFDAINAIAERHNIPVIEDAAQSFGAKYKNQFSCNLTTIACTSFFPSKPLGCYGDGGACFTNNDELALKMRQIRLHGQEKRYYHTQIGVNGRLDTLQAAFLLEKLAIFPDEIILRQAVAKRYELLLPHSIRKQIIPSEYISIFAQYTIEVEDRDRIQQLLQQKNIPTAVHYPLGLHQQPAIRAIYPDQASYPVSEAAARKVMSLPMHPYLSEADQREICQTLAAVLELSSLELQ